jgi:uncharacterized protein YbaR (Trm112 family)
MIKVLQHGIMKITCPNCKAKLQYEQEDIISEKRPNGKRWIICPDCNKEVIINKGKTSEDDDLVGLIDNIEI